MNTSAFRDYFTGTSDVLKVLIIAQNITSYHNTWTTKYMSKFIRFFTYTYSTKSLHRFSSIATSVLHSITWLLPSRLHMKNGSDTAKWKRGWCVPFLGTHLSLRPVWRRLGTSQLYNLVLHSTTHLCIRYWPNQKHLQGSTLTLTHFPLESKLKLRK